MEANEQITQQVGRFIRKVAEKFPITDELSLITDIHVRASQETGELLAYDDDDNEITRVTIEAWFNCQDENFDNIVTSILREALLKNEQIVGNLGILKPYNFVLESYEEKEYIAELFLADDDTVIIGGDLMPNLDEDLNHFLDELQLED
ncbi:hypothetical protein [Segatella bryantii]|uniref:hypothetical protein n=1 Tax=Segatella bryantii TaxID=77095 RepID=UPI00242C8A46|nr:hypothetical protein [Segatella bryantii]